MKNALFLLAAIIMGNGSASGQSCGGGPDGRGCGSNPFFTLGASSASPGASSDIHRKEPRIKKRALRARKLDRSAVKQGGASEEPQR